MVLAGPAPNVVDAENAPADVAPDLEVYRLTATSKVAALKELVDHLYRRQAVADGLQFLQSVLTRESLESTIVADAVALPHARCHSALRLAAAMGVAQPPLQYASGDDLRRVSVICLIAVPTQAPGRYLEWMGALARRLSQPEVRSRLRSVTAEQMEELLSSSALPAGAAGRPPREIL